MELSSKVENTPFTVICFQSEEDVSIKQILNTFKDKSKNTKIVIFTPKQIPKKKISSKVQQLKVGPSGFPDSSDFLLFKLFVAKSLVENHNLEIAIVCIYNLSASCYVIARWLIDEQGFNLTNAIQTVKKAFPGKDVEFGLYNMLKDKYSYDGNPIYFKTNELPIPPDEKEIDSEKKNFNNSVNKTNLPPDISIKPQFLNSNTIDKLSNSPNPTIKIFHVNPSKITQALQQSSSVMIDNSQKQIWPIPKSPEPLPHQKKTQPIQEDINIIKSTNYQQEEPINFLKSHSNIHSIHPHHHRHQRQRQRSNHSPEETHHSYQNNLEPYDKSTTALPATFNNDYHQENEQDFSKIQSYTTSDYYSYNRENSMYSYQNASYNYQNSYYPNNYDQYHQQQPFHNPPSSNYIPYNSHQNPELYYYPPSQPSNYDYTYNYPNYHDSYRYQNRISNTDYYDYTQSDQYNPIPPPSISDPRDYHQIPLPPPPTNDPRDYHLMPPPPSVTDPRNYSPMPLPPSSTDPRNYNPIPPPPSASGSRDYSPIPPSAIDPGNYHSIPPPPVNDIRNYSPIPLPPSSTDPRNYSPIPPPPSVNDPRDYSPIPPPPSVNDPRDYSFIPPPPPISDPRDYHLTLPPSSINHQNFTDSSFDPTNLPSLKSNDLDSTNDNKKYLSYEDESYKMPSKTVQSFEIPPSIHPLPLKPFEFYEDQPKPLNPQESTLEETKQPELQEIPPPPPPPATSKKLLLLMSSSSDENDKEKDHHAIENPLPSIDSEYHLFSRIPISGIGNDTSPDEYGEVCKDIASYLSIPSINVQEIQSLPFTHEEQLTLESFSAMKKCMDKTIFFRPIPAGVRCFLVARGSKHFLISNEMCREVKMSLFLDSSDHPLTMSLFEGFLIRQKYQEKPCFFITDCFNVGQDLSGLSYKTRLEEAEKISELQTKSRRCEQDSLLLRVADTFQIEKFEEIENNYHFDFEVLGFSFFSPNSIRQTKLNQFNFNENGNNNSFGFFINDSICCNRVFSWFKDGCPIVEISISNTMKCVGLARRNSSDELVEAVDFGFAKKSMLRFNKKIVELEFSTNLSKWQIKCISSKYLTWYADDVKNIVCGKEVMLLDEVKHEIVELILSNKKE